jgi:GT2 family glycosyltransferase
LAQGRTTAESDAPDLRHSIEAQATQSPAVSVVIPTFNRPQALQTCLEALFDQVHMDPGFEIIVVDDGGACPVQPDLRHRPPQVSVRVVRQTNAGPAAARNRGARLATGCYLAFTDDDCRPSATWLRSLLDALDRQPHALVGGHTRNAVPENLCAETNQWILQRVYSHFNSDPSNAHFFASNNFACASRRFRALGGFDESFFYAGGEDRDFCDRWRRAGGALVAATTAQVDHKHPQTVPMFLRMHWRYGYGAFQVQARRRQHGAGDMKVVMAFHRSLLASTWPQLRGYGNRRRLQMLALLALWQLANLAGFLLAAWRTRWRLRISRSR